MRDKDGNVLETQTVNGYVGEDYTTTRKEFDGYRSYGENPANASGKFTETRITVTYVYEKIPAQVVVKHVDTEGNILVDDVVIDGKQGESYTTERKTIYGYNDDFYLFHHINDVSFNEDNELLPTEYVLKLDKLYKKNC